MVGTLPAGWVARLEESANLEASFQELDGVTGDFAETMRGRVRSMQVRLKDGDRHFKRAASLWARAPQDELGTLHRGLVHLIYAREHAILRGDLESWEVDMPSVLQGSDENMQRYVQNFRALTAAENLYRGDSESARMEYEFLLKSDTTARPEGRALWSLGLGSAHWNLGHEKEARKSFEVAGLYAQTVPRLLGLAKLSAKLSAIYHAIGETAESYQWQLFSQRLDCPDATKRAMAERGRILCARSKTLLRLVLV